MLICFSQYKNSQFKFQSYWKCSNEVADWILYWCKQLPIL